MVDGTSGRGLAESGEATEPTTPKGGELRGGAGRGEGHQSSRRPQSRGEVEEEGSRQGSESLEPGGMELKKREAAQKGSGKERHHLQERLRRIRERSISGG